MNKRSKQVNENRPQNVKVIKSNNKKRVQHLERSNGVGIFENVIYSNGPGDNVYVFG